MNYTISRRSLLVGASTAATLMPFRHAAAWAPAPIDPYELTAGTWFQQVKSQHVAIADALEGVISDAKTATSVRTPGLRQLSYLLTAHSVAEENVLYPALAFAGLTVDSADLYLEQQFQKIWNADIDLKAGEGQRGTEWIEKVQRLQKAVLEHAKDHEEEDYYPKLHAKLDDAQGVALSVAFKASFLMIKAP